MVNRGRGRPLPSNSESSSEGGNIRSQASTSPAITAGAESGSRIAIAMYAVLLLSYSVNAMDRQLFPVLASDVRRDYGFSLANIGLLSTIFTLGMAVAGLPTGYLLTRFSRKYNWWIWSRYETHLTVKLFDARTSAQVWFVDALCDFAQGDAHDAARELTRAVAEKLKPGAGGP